MRKVRRAKEMKERIAERKEQKCDRKNSELETENVDAHYKPEVNGSYRGCLVDQCI